MERARVLVVDDKENILKLFARILGDGYEVTSAADGGRAISLIGAQEFDVIVTDLRMPGADGFEVLRAAKARAPDTEVVMMTAYATVQDAVTAMKQGAYDYLQKPFDPDDAALVVARALERKRLRAQAETLLRELEGVYAFHNLVGKSAPMKDVYRLLEQASKLDITVLLNGETGTGKELAARAIHYHSARKERRFVPVNCGALPSELVESELFGHAKGAFTGAVGAKPGLFEEAEGGTIFLDEIGELPLAVQVKLNRVLQEKEIRRVGDNRPVKVDVRVIAATHRDLRAEVAAGRFREDLFYRVNVFPVVLPALRDRRDDIPLLASHFLEKHAGALRKPISGVEADALRALTGYPWPGNVRELENAIERAVAVARGAKVELRDLPPEVKGTQEGAIPGEVLARMPYRDAVDLARDRVSRDYLTVLMREHEGNVTHAALQAGMERESLHRLLKRYGIRSDDFKTR
ncbi:sigma-54-dependent transcriptional regulator [Anaeromyxobacter terrae]|uniref:sigma-54-dependent transcriptional regulator n=1 Tax=Anaeromyxobacter terrae TaxID=2925406 RepID=UPI001F56BC90|nr:sigma-54 dependent transcriptional regulator [Anaeromyxobacter sp. SG22]